MSLKLENRNRDFLSEFNGVQSNTIFCLWAGSNAMSPQRIQALWSIYNNTRCQIAFINSNSIRDWERPEYPFHPAFDDLSDTHKSDYLRCYLMHHYGGGWADIKHTSSDWRPSFRKLRQSDSLALGYQEIPEGIPHISGPLGDEIRLNYHSVIGLCAFIFKKQSEITLNWIKSTHQTLDIFETELKSHPAKHPQDQKNLLLPDGSRSRYPLEWATILGEIFHPIVYRSRERILQSKIMPALFGYR